MDAGAITLICLAGGVLLVLATFMGFVLGWANKAFQRRPQEIRKCISCLVGQQD